MRQSILVVDDTIENINVLKAILIDDYDVRAATNGILALKIAEKVLPDIILLDIMMPDMDGYEVCAKLKANPITEQIPVIFVTAMNEEKDEAKGFSIGAIDYITKPVSPIVVKARIRAHLFIVNQQRELDLQVKEKTVDLENSRIDLVRRLGRAAEYKDNETGLHVIRMSKYSKIIAINYGIPEKAATLLELASPMHDIGKIGIADKILGKPGKLNPEEWVLMQEHSEIGRNILGEHKDELLNTASIVAMQHHERWNGKGYPKGLKENNIHIFARIVAIADVFDALTSERPYKNAWTNEKAIEYIKSESGEHFDPKVVVAFEKSLKEIIEVKNKYIES